MSTDAWLKLMLTEPSKTTNSMEFKINIDKLLVTELSKDMLLVRRDIDIPHPHAHTLSKLQGMLNNPNRTLLEMQDTFKQDAFSTDEHNVCLLHEYNEPFVQAIKYPEFISYCKYHRMISEKREFLSKSRNNHGKLPSPEKVEEWIDAYKKSLKHEFMDTVKRYVYAEDYITLYRQIVLLDSLKIISEEKIGWSIYEHRPNKDTSFRISTNYGYGRSAYFRVNMCYKGVDILPYSHVVTYAIAKMEDLVRATRNYSAHRENWPMAMDFMIETSNLAFQDEDKFLKVWLKNEVDEMMSGLRQICNHPEDVICQYEKKVNDPTPYLAVRNFTKKEVELYKANIKEMSILLKVTKVSGALTFLDNLQAIARVFGYVGSSLIELRGLAFSIIPDVNSLISALKKELKRLKNEINVETLKLKNLQEKLKPFNLALEKLFKEQGETSYKGKQAIEAEFMKDNKRYTSLLDEASKQQKVVWAKEQFFIDRNNFYENLSNQRDLILSQAAKIESND